MCLHYTYQDHMVCNCGWSTRGHWVWWAHPRRALFCALSISEVKLYNKDANSFHFLLFLGFNYWNYGANRRCLPLKPFKQMISFVYFQFSTSMKPLIFYGSNQTCRTKDQPPCHSSNLKGLCVVLSLNLHFVLEILNGISLLRFCLLLLFLWNVLRVVEGFDSICVLKKEIISGGCLSFFFFLVELYRKNCMCDDKKI